MSSLPEINVQRAIVHIINHIRRQECIYSQHELPLAQEERVRSYFEGQIINVLEDGAISQATYDDQSASASRTPEICLKILQDAGNFVDDSRVIAEELLTAMGKDGRIRPERSSLAVCLYEKDGSKHLALLKLDPSEALVPKIEYDSAGQPLWVNFEIRDDAMPTTRERLQKAALVLTERSAKGHDLLLLDRQTSKDAADFFARKFLKAKSLMDAVKHTDLLYEALWFAYNDLTMILAATKQPKLTPDDAERLRLEIDAVMQKSRIDTLDWLGGLDLPEIAKETIRVRIEDNIPVERQFELSPEYAKSKLIPRRRIRGEYGVLFEVEDRHWSDVVLEEHRAQVDGKPVITLRLKITGYQEMMKK
ncbi:MAG: hypothetical protein HPY76_10475 [Anaerolineae bacterium]|nr:hypothetical protein [Anaerolineae bacterium]